MSVDWPSVRPKSVHRKVLLAAITAAAVAFAAVLVGVFPVPGFRQAAKEKAAERVVEGYMRALASGDARRALDYIDLNSNSSSLLTDEVLADSLTRAPITDVKVPRPLAEGDGYSVYVQFKVGGVRMDQNLILAKRDGDWKIDGETAVIDVSTNYVTSSLEINGAPVPDGVGHVYLFPGSYIVTTTSDYYTFDTFEFELNRDGRSLKIPDPRLTQGGIDIFRAAVSAALSECLGQKGSAAGCGLGLPSTLDDGTLVDEGSVVRTAEPEVWEELATCRPILVDGIIGQLPDSLGNVSVTGTGVKGGQHTSFTREVPLKGWVIVHLNSTERDVVW